MEIPLRGAARALHDDTSWTAERNNWLARLWAQGWSATDIALEMGDLTRNAVCGKVHRLGLPARRTRQGGRPQTRHIACHIIKVAKDSAEKTIAEASPEVVLDVAPHQRVPLLALKADSCRFPLGEPQDPDFGFCPHVHADGSSYCPGHHHLAYTPRAPGRPRHERKQTGWG